jgi:hypothetical protein
MGAVTQVTSSDHKPGAIFQQNPGPNTRVAAGTAISISVATPKLVSVPALRHLQRNDAIHETPSEIETGFVQSQDIPQDTLVSPGTSVGFAVSRQIARTLVLRSSHKNISPGESIVLSAELEPPFPGAEYQFSFGADNLVPGQWSSDAQALFRDLQDGDYEAVAAARWSDRSVESNRVRIVVHAVKYELRLLPRPMLPKLGEVVSFDAQLSPDKESATYIFHFGDATEDQSSSTPHAEHVYRSAGSYFAQVTARIRDTLPAGQAPHSHAFASPAVRLVVARASPILYYLLGLAAIPAAAYLIRRWTRGRSRVRVLVHRDPGVQIIEDRRRGPQGNGVEINVVRSWGEQTIQSRGPLCARIEAAHE